MSTEVYLRDVIDSDLPIFFEQQLDPDANYMAAFTAEDPRDRTAFDAHWYRIRRDNTVIIKTIVCDEQVAGNIVSYEHLGEREVGYWIGKPFWGRGIASRALALFLRELTARPLHARAAKDNVGSLRVLEKCGFVRYGEDTGYSSARGGDVEEYLLKLE